MIKLSTKIIALLLSSVFSVAVFANEGGGGTSGSSSPSHSDHHGGSRGSSTRGDGEIMFDQRVQDAIRGESIGGTKLSRIHNRSNTNEVLSHHLTEHH